jgi:hypothetical protein
MTEFKTIICGDAKIDLEITNGWLISLGAITIDDVAIRNSSTRFLPWFDTYDGEVFRQFRLLDIKNIDGVTRIRTMATSDPDALFRERRDCSGDPVFRNANWDSSPLEAEFTICFSATKSMVRGNSFTGFKYWFEYDGTLPIHRIIDRQTWEIGGCLDDVTICLRNWLTPPNMKIDLHTIYSTVGLDKWATLLPGSLWGRWSLLPSFDMQYGKDGVLLGWFDEVSLIRTVIESNAGEDCLRYLDMHEFEQSTKVSTNPKSIIHSSAILDEVDALNMWLEISGNEAKRSMDQFGIINETPPAIVFGENVWHNMNFDTTYEHAVEVASEFGADYVFIDPVWEHQEALKMAFDAAIPPEKQKGTIFEKWWHQNMCVTLDFEVADIMGGEERLKALCDRAQAKGIQILSWMATHYSMNTNVQYEKSLEHGAFGIFAAKESGRHPDTGYAASCWTANLNGPIADKIKQQILGVCERTGLAGFLWDSFSNLGWWQIDYSDGSMRPQFDKMAELYATLNNAGIYIQPEALVTFSNHSCCGLHGGNIYAGNMIGYSYNTVIGLWFGDGDDRGDATLDCQILKGDAPIDQLFQCIAYKRIPNLGFHTVPYEHWNPDRVQQIKDLLAIYKKYRDLMIKPTVMKEYAGVLWENDSNMKVYFSFVPQDAPINGKITDVLTGDVINGKLEALKVYLIVI